MRYLNKSFLALLCAAGLLGACDTEDTYDVLDIEVPAGYELSAGTSTLFVRSSKAYDVGDGCLQLALQQRRRTL